MLTHELGYCATFPHFTVRAVSVYRDFSETCLTCRSEQTGLFTLCLIHIKAYLIVNCPISNPRGIILMDVWAWAWFGSRNKWFLCANMTKFVFTFTFWLSLSSHFFCFHFPFFTFPFGFHFSFNFVVFSSTFYRFHFLLSAASTANQQFDLRIVLNWLTTGACLANEKLL